MFTINAISLKYHIDNQTREIKLSKEIFTQENDDLSISHSTEEELSGHLFRLNATPKIEITLDSLEIILDAPYEQARTYFSNGFQSWSESKLYSKNEHIQPIGSSARKRYEYVGDSHLHETQTDEIHSWGYTYYNTPNKRVVFIGSIDEGNAWTNFIHQPIFQKLIVRRDVQNWKISEPQTIASIFYAENTERGAFQHYFMLCDIPEYTQEGWVAWTSWREKYAKISEENLLQDIEQITQNQLPIETFIISEGHQSRIGDWLQDDNLTHDNLRNLSDKIHTAGMKAGIWLAPFVVEEESLIFKNHPSWMVQDEQGKPLPAGQYERKNMYALDITQTDVQNHIIQTLQFYTTELGFDLVSIDLLYPLNIQTNHNQTRAQLMHQALKLIRQNLPDDRLIMAQGIPLNAAINWADYFQISTKTSLGWNRNNSKKRFAREKFTTLSSITSTINKRQWNRQAWSSFSDAFQLRHSDSKLNKQQTYTQLLTHLIFNDTLLLNDHFSKYQGEDWQLLKSIFPLVRRKEINVEYSEGLYRIFFQIEDRRYLAYINLSNKDLLHKLSPGIYFDGHRQVIMTHAQTISIPKHSSTLLHICSSGPFGVLGSDTHIFPGSEITKIALRGRDIHVELREGLLQDPTIYLKAPKDFTGTTINGIEFEMIQKKEFAVLKVTLPRGV